MSEQAAQASTPVPPPDNTSDSGLNPSPASPAANDDDEDAKMLSLGPVVDYIEIRSRVDALVERVSWSQLNDALKECGGRGFLKSPPEIHWYDPEFEEWARRVHATGRAEQARKGAAPGPMPDLHPIPIPMPGWNSRRLLTFLDDYAKTGRAWLNSMEHARKRLALPTGGPERPKLPSFVPNTVPTFEGDPSAPSIAPNMFGFTSRVEAPDVEDSSAPAITRGHFKHSYAFIYKGDIVGGWTNDVLFLSNVDYIPEPPPNEFPTRRVDGRFGHHEATRFAQWHEVGRYHMAFVPTCMDGRVERLYHRSLTGDMAWYDVDFDEHCVKFGDPEKGDNRPVTASRALRDALTAAWTKAHDEYVHWGNVRGAQPGIPHVQFLRGKQALGFLGHAMSRRELVDTLAGFQRALQEVRGWNNYQQCRSELGDIAKFYARRGTALPPAVNTEKQPWHRKPYRGIFTWDENVAKRVAQFGVPAFLMVSLKRDQLLDPVWKRVDLLRPQYESAVWDDVRGPSYVAAVQETQPLPIADIRGLAEPPPAIDDHRQSHADDAPQQEYDDVPMSTDDPAVIQDEDRASVATSGARQAASSTQASAQTQASAREQTEAREVVRAGKRKADDVAEDARPAKRVRSQAGSVPQATRAQVRHPKAEVFTWPTYFPQPWTVAQQATKSVMCDDKRYHKLYVVNDDEWPMNDALLHGRELMTPTPSLFARITKEGYLSRMFASYVALRPSFIKEAATRSSESAHRFTSAQWRNILRGFVPSPAHLQYGLKLGLYSDQREDRVWQGEESSAAGTSDEGRGHEESVSLDAAALAAAAAAAAASNSALPQSRPSTQLPAHDEREVLPFMDLEEEETPEQAAQDFEAHVFVNPLPPGERPLAPEEERYLHEPSAWRMKGVGQLRSLDYFRWYVEEDSEVDYAEQDARRREDGRVFDMVAAGKQKRKNLDDYDLWWNYERGWVLAFELTSGFRAVALGERLTKKLRFFQADGAQGRKKFLHDSEHAPMQLRVWQARPMNQSLSLGYDPLGQVGVRTQCPNWLKLEPDAYAVVFAGARDVARIAAQRRREEEERRAAEEQRLAEEQRAAEEQRLAEEQRVVQQQRGVRQVGAPVAPVVRPAVASAVLPNATVFKGPKPNKRKDKGKKQGNQDNDAGGEDAGVSDARVPQSDWNLISALTPRVPMFDGVTLPEYASPPNSDPDFATYSWPSETWRRYIIWDVAELLFRFEFYALDAFLRLQYPRAPALAQQSNLERLHAIFAVWQGENFLPNGASPLTAADWRTREPAVRAFAQIVQTWPRTSIPDAPVTFTQHEFEAFERGVWTAYAQTYTDYHWREAPFPFCYPDVVPFS